MNSKSPITFIYLLNGKYEKYFLQNSCDEIKKVLLGEDTFESLETGFSGFHDWLHENSDPSLSARVLGVEIFPFNLQMNKEFSADKKSLKLESGVTIVFDQNENDYYSGGEQSFAYHQYFSCRDGRIAVALDLCDLSESELSDFKFRCRDLAKIVE